nr:UDP-glycosyltransferase 74G1-like [Tanacetum cinerariifolium]
PVTFETFSDGFDDNGHDQLVPHDVYFPKLREEGSKSLSNLVEKLDSITAIIYDGFLPWALDVAKRFKIFGVIFFTQTCAVNNIYYHVDRNLLKIPLTLSLLPEALESKHHEARVDHGRCHQTHQRMFQRIGALG